MGGSWRSDPSRFNWIKSHFTPNSNLFWSEIICRNYPINMLILTPDFVKLYCWRWRRDTNVLILFLSLSSLSFSHSVLCREEQNFNNSLIHFHFINILSFWHCAYGELLSTLLKGLILPQDSHIPPGVENPKCRCYSTFWKELFSFSSR